MNPHHNTPSSGGAHNPFRAQPQQPQGTNSPFGPGNAGNDSPFGPTPTPSASPFGTSPPSAGSPFGSNQPPHNSPFGGQQPPPPASHAFGEAIPPAATPQALSYSTGIVDDLSDKRNPSLRHTSIVNAPYALWIAAALYGLGLIHVGWMLANECTRSNPRDILVLILGICIVALIVGVVGVLKAQSWARWILASMTVLGILVVILPGQWYLAPLGIAGAILVWLPSNRPWFGYRTQN
ncbi:hypothetical protein P4N68_03585 [Corynebacterium felinum]|uniref:IgA FC receptor n=1 Tax=Corynebacterium felinum TaxID=131318 RepID=A0ABU2B5M1_9CORY|nr:hypothetical protein [Corynebacterium felinum]MDF5820165.1 hypothetical protein [Corynebacterium felinum]MDR7353917.1 hypothetical protein [Corynebacterium felinum]WJY96090.1 hypothetical protein CFELI_12550 [Corynebacterium felinum]